MGQQTTVHSSQVRCGWIDGCTFLETRYSTISRRTSVYMISHSACEKSVGKMMSLVTPVTWPPWYNNHTTSPDWPPLIVHPNCGISNAREMQDHRYAAMQGKFQNKKKITPLAHIPFALSGHQSLLAVSLKLFQLGLALAIVLSHSVMRLFCRAALRTLWQLVWSVAI